MQKNLAKQPLTVSGWNLFRNSVPLTKYQRHSISEIKATVLIKIQALEFRRKYKKIQIIDYQAK
jgi:hypothetical protein